MKLPKDVCGFTKFPSCYGWAAAFIVNLWILTDINTQHPMMFLHILIPAIAFIITLYVWCIGTMKKIESRVSPQLLELYEEAQGDEDLFLQLVTLKAMNEPQIIQEVHNVFKVDKTV